ncbi:pyocin activator PrtN family protein [Onishia taeanensis]|nr:pyocin activator PrtN family protein [Halomonas taeanensis]
MPAWGDEAPDTSTVALLYQQFGDVLIELEAVRKAYFRNRSSERFRRGLREGVIPLPVVRLDDSAKGQGYVCIYQLAAFIEHQAREAAAQRDVMITTSNSDIQLRRRLIAAVPTTHYPDASSG